jgi:ABC-2 type transport system permease protein
MSIAARIAREEWRALLRNRAGLIATLLILALVAAAAMVSLERRGAIEQERARLQAGVDMAFDHQPDRHPHRMVHYGQFVFRPIEPLAFFDFGVDGFTGNTIFLEGHRQNSANFAEARQSSLLLRFGQLTPAFVLQILSPLLILFLGFGTVARERERGTLRLLLSQGVSGRQLLGGKFLGLAAIAITVAAPAFLLLLGMAVVGAAGWVPSLLLIGGYAMWLLIWAALSVMVSALVSRGRDALLALVGIWMVSVILLPRALPQVAASQVVLPGQIETEVALHHDLKKIGDAHNPDDPYFNDFKARTLARYGVKSVQELPVQYAGLVGMEGERLTTELYARAGERAAAVEQTQNGFVRAFAVLSPVIAIRDLSMALAGSDLASHQRFLDAAEAFRYSFVQTLNRLQVDLIPNVNPGEDPRVSAANWRRVPRFTYRPANPVTAGGQVIWSSLAVLIGWLAVLGALSARIARALGRAGR